MDYQLEPGLYVAAVSGGVDSMAMLDMLRRLGEIKIIVAHLDHGIREDSAQDRRLVQAYAAQHGLPFVYHEISLGEGASEDLARRARYDFLHQVRQASGARAVLTAHHQDDVLETAVHHILRGTSRKGLAALGHQPHVIRPLLHANKASLQAYAKGNGLTWREDSTNTNTAYTRNHIRHNVLPRLSAAQKQSLLSYIKRVRELNHEIDALLINYLHQQPSVVALDRREFMRLPHAVAREVMAAWLRNNGIRQFDRRLLENLVIAAKTLRVGKFMSIDGRYSLSITKEELALVSRDR